jgi:hypothetical protein
MHSDKNQQKIYSAGECPVCADSGAVLLLKAHGSERMFFLCPLCGVSWPEPPSGQQLETVFNLTTFAPTGVLLPTADEALRTGFSLDEVSFDDWYPLLKDLLPPAGA